MRYIVLFIIMMLVSWATFAGAAAAPHWTQQDVAFGFFIAMFTSISTMPFPPFLALAFITADLAAGHVLRFPWDTLGYIAGCATVLFLFRLLFGVYYARFEMYYFGSVLLPAVASAAVPLLDRVLVRSWSRRA